MVSRLAAALGAVVALGCAAATPPTMPFELLYVIDTDGAPPLGDAVIVEVTARDPDALASALPPGAVLSKGPTHLTVRLDPYPAVGTAESPRLESTFLVDFEDEVVQDWIAGRAGEADPSLHELVRWTREAITPANDRGFDPASVVLRNGRGDCTEHAVLMAALARHFGHPARVVAGIVVIRIGDGVGAFGHAWTEILADGAWQLVDPTPIEGGHPIGYLPEGVLSNEGPGFSLGLMQLFDPGVSRVRVVPSTD